MELFYGGGGARNPNFAHKVKIKRYNQNVSEMMEWCNEYPVTGSGYFQRYYVDFRNGREEAHVTDYVTFQFEWEQPAILFALKFGAA